MTQSAFILASALGGSMIVSRFDHDARNGAGVGLEVLDGRRNLTEGFMATVARLCAERRKSHGDGVVLLDGGANIGSYSVPWARFMQGWGEVICFEPQRWPFYALCGNLALNNCFNTQALQAALSDVSGNIQVPFWHPLEQRNSGGLSLLSADERTPGVKFLNEGPEARESHPVIALTVDALELPRLDIMKLDVEGMEPHVLRGARQTLQRHGPIVLAESFLCSPDAIRDLLPDYIVAEVPDHVLCVHREERNQQLLREIEALKAHNEGMRK